MNTKLSSFTVFVLAVALAYMADAFANHQINIAKGEIHYKKAGCTGGGCEIIFKNCIISEDLEPSPNGTLSNTNVRCIAPLYNGGYNMPILSPNGFVSPGKHELQSSADGGQCEIVPRSGANEMKYSTNWTSDAWYTINQLEGAEGVFFNLNVAIACYGAAK